MPSGSDADRGILGTGVVDRLFADPVPGRAAIARRQNAVRGAEPEAIRIARVDDQLLRRREAAVGGCRTREQHQARSQSAASKKERLRKIIACFYSIAPGLAKARAALGVDRSMQSFSWTRLFTCPAGH